MLEIPRIPYSWQASQEYPLPRIETSHGGLSNIRSEAAKNTPLPRIGTPHGGLSNFGFEAAKNTAHPLGLELCRALVFGD